MQEVVCGIPVGVNPTVRVVRSGRLDEYERMIEGLRVECVQVWGDRPATPAEIEAENERRAKLAAESRAISIANAKAALPGLKQEVARLEAILR